MPKRLVFLGTANRLFIFNDHSIFLQKNLTFDDLSKNNYLKHN